MELLRILFEEQDMHTLQRVLEICNGNVLKAIEHFANIRQNQNIARMSFMASRIDKKFCDASKETSPRPQSKSAFFIESLLQVKY
uniref:DMA domain-containing protein n=1 Tax=Caenorhabditis japonica TaxID=281687 RepID=A0A8R1I248_CAEJA